MTHILTLETLKAKGACSAAQQKFAEIFPNGADLTVETFVDVADQFNWACAAKLLLAPRNQVRFTALQKVALADYDATRAAGRATYVAAYAACDLVRDAACAAYDAYAATRYAARAAARATVATAFAILYIEQESQTL